MNEMSDGFYDNGRSVALYSSLVEKYGISHRSLDWGSRETQVRRFNVLQEMADFDGQSVLDVGCGLGDFYGHLQAQGLNVEYHGVDITPAMVSAANKRYPDIDIQLGDVIKDEISEKYDYVVASGIFYLLPTLGYAEELIASMFRLSNKAIGFNSLSTWASNMDDGELYLDPAETVSLCHSLASKVVLRHDYMPNDFTMFIYKENL